MREQIEEIEEQLLDLDTNKLWALFILTPLFIFGAFYYFLLDDKLVELEDKRGEIASLDKAIVKSSPRIYFKKIKQMSKKIRQTKTDIDLQKSKEFALEGRLKKLRFLFSDEKDFNIFLESLLKKSVADNFTIHSLSINDEDKTYVGMLHVKKSVILQGEGNFINTLLFVRNVENNKMLISIKKLNLETNGTLPQTNLLIEFYGVN
jgi:HPt (histidine-containing phosphotransfer) domain-containing protein